MRILLLLLLGFGFTACSTSRPPTAVTPETGAPPVIADTELTPELGIRGALGQTTKGRKTARPLEIVEIMPRYMEAANFRRIAEYMTGKEYPGKRVIVRSQPEERDGFYFVLILNQSVRKLPADTWIEGEFYTSTSLDLQTFRFDLPSTLPHGREVFIGLTGDDWPGIDTTPAAWRFTVRNSQQAPLARKQSFLWSL